MIKIECKCGSEIFAPDSGEATCADCGTLYTVSGSQISWTNPTEWISLAQASRRFNVPLPTLRYHAVRGHFEARKPDKRTWLCEAGSVEEWVKGRRK